MSGEDEADTSYNAEDAIPILPPDAFLREQLSPGRAITSLTDEQKAAVTALDVAAQAMADEFNYDDAKRAWLDTACLCRYLRAREWNVEESTTLLRNSLLWRNERKVWQIREEHHDKLKNEIRTGKTYRNGFDLQGRPIMYFRDRRQNTKDYIQQVNGVINTFERAIETMDVSKGVEQWCLLFDFNGYSMSNAPPMSTSREILDIMMNCYPERLGVAVMMDAPWLFNMFWRAISVFIPASTRAKVLFISGSAKEKCEQLSAIIDPAVLEKPFGGSNDCKYVAKLYWERETKQHEKYLAHEASLLNEPDTSTASTSSSSAPTSGAKTRRRKKKK